MGPRQGVPVTAVAFLARLPASSTVLIFIRPANVSNKNDDAINPHELVSFYERVVDPLTLPIGIQSLDLIGIGSSQTLIDVAAGTGTLAVEAAKRGIHVLASDIEPNMVARAAARLAPFNRCEARVASFTALDVPDSSFDAAVSIVGVLAFPEGREGLRELVRVTRGGGYVAVATWDQERPAAPQYLARDIFAGLFPGRQLWPSDFFPAWTKDAVAAALREAGCIRATIAGVEGAWTVESPARVMDDSGTSIRMFPGYRALSEPERSLFEEAFVAAVAERADSDGVARLATRAFVVTATVPG